jgi:C_GCAxxG_C_C family probable redox protein
MCGAVSGAIMAINLFFGRSAPDESVETSYIAVRKLVDRFESKFVSRNCEKLIGCDLGTKEGQQYFRSNNVIEGCRHCTEEATRMAMSIIEGKGEEA